MHVTHLLVACLCCAAATNSASTSESDVCGQTIENVNFADDGDAKQRTSPWMVVLGIYEAEFQGEEEQFMVECSGSLLTSSLVITAAHCFYSGDLEHYVRAGVSNIRYRGAQESRVKEVLLHPNYASPKVYYDVGLARLEDVLQLSAKVAPICLPASPLEPDSLEGDGVTVQGWGSSDDNVDNEQLTEIDVTVRPLGYCNHKFQGLDAASIRVYYPQLLTEVMFCADHNVNKDIGTCYGDSGGPTIKKVLDEKDWSERFTLVGIVSGNPKGCRGFREYPDYFTFIGHEQVGRQLLSAKQTWKSKVSINVKS